MAGPRRVQRRLPARPASEPTLVETGPAADRAGRARGARRGSGSAPATSPTWWSPTSTWTTPVASGRCSRALPARRRLGARAWGAAPRRSHEAGRRAPRARTARSGCGSLFGDTSSRWPADRIRAVADGDRIAARRSIPPRPPHARARLAPRGAARSTPPGRSSRARRSGRTCPGPTAIARRSRRPRSTSRWRSPASSAIRARARHRAADLALRAGRRRRGRVRPGVRRGSSSGPRRSGDGSTRTRTRTLDELTDAAAWGGGRRSPRGRRRADRPRALRRDRLDPDERAWASARYWRKRREARQARRAG